MNSDEIVQKKKTDTGARRATGPSSRVAWGLAVALTSVSLGACADDAAKEDDSGGAATIEKIKGSDLSRVTLTASAAKRLGLRTEKVRSSGSGTEIPYAAVLYDPDGHTWTFAKVKGLTFERRAITVASITGESASIESGPPAGTEIVTLGATELYGAEIGVGDE